jgi:hypothetical protein
MINNHQQLAVSKQDCYRAAQRWKQLGVSVIFRCQPADQPWRRRQLCYQVDEQRQVLVISYSQQFTPYYFFYQNCEAWAAAQGLIGPDSDPEQRSRAQAGILQELFTFYPPAIEYQQQRVKDYISKLSTNTDRPAAARRYLGPRLQALDAWELLPIIANIDRQLATELQAWRQQSAIG